MPRWTRRGFREVSGRVTRHWWLPVLATGLAILDFGCAGGFNGQVPVWDQITRADYEACEQRVVAALGGWGNLDLDRAKAEVRGCLTAKGYELQPSPAPAGRPREGARRAPDEWI